MRLALVLLGACAAAADLETVKSEPNPEKRSRIALDYAASSLTSARKAYADGDIPKTAGALDDLARAVVLAESSLAESGKNPSKSPKHFKHAEIRTSELVRKLGAFGHEMSYTNRPLAEKVRETVQEVHDRLLAGIMGRKK